MLFGVLVSQECLIYEKFDGHGQQHTSQDIFNGTDLGTIFPDMQVSC